MGRLTWQKLRADGVPKSQWPEWALRAYYGACGNIDHDRGRMLIRRRAWIAEHLNKGSTAHAGDSAKVQRSATAD